MTPIRSLFVLAVLAALGFFVTKKWSAEPSELPALQPPAAETSSVPSGARAPELVPVAESGPPTSERRPADAPGAPDLAEISSESPPEAPSVEDPVSDLDAQRALVTEIALLEAERDELYLSLGALTKDAYEAAWARNDYEELDAGPTTGRDIDGKLVSMRHLPDGRRQMVTLPRTGFEEAYRVYDLSREMSGQVRKKQAELRAMRKRPSQD